MLIKFSPIVKHYFKFIFVHQSLLQTVKDGFYIYNTFTFTDHKALLQIYFRTSKPSASSERWVLHLQHSDFEIKYKKGTENLEAFYTKWNWKICYQQICALWYKVSVNRHWQNQIWNSNRDTLNFEIKALKDNSWPKNSPSLHPFSKILQELQAKQHYFKEQQNQATKTLIQKGSINSTPKPLGKWEN